MSPHLESDVEGSSWLHILSETLLFPGVHMNFELEGHPDVLVEGVSLGGTGWHAHQEQDSGQEQQQMDGHLLQNFYGRRLPQVANGRGCSR